MAIVHIPTQLRSLAGGRDRVEAPGSTLRQVIEALDAACPGMKDQLVEDGKIRFSSGRMLQREINTLLGEAEADIDRYC